MTYNVETLPQDFIRYVRDLQAWAGHEAHSYRLARALRMRVQLGVSNYVIPEGDPSPVIVLTPWWYGGNNDVTRHEIAHVMLWWSGLESRILHEYGPESGWSVIESLCNSAVAFLHITQPMVDEAVRRYGVTARAVRYLQKISGADAHTALRRLVYDDPAAERAGFLTSGRYIAEVEANNYALPFWRLDRVPEPTERFPAEARATFARLPGGSRLLGICGA